MRTSRTFLTAALVAAAGLALFGGAVATAQEDNSAPVEAAGSSPEALVADLAELEVLLADVDELTFTVTDTADTADTEEAESGDRRLLGDFVGASVLYESLHDRVLNLYVSANDTTGPVAAAVADAARAHLLTEEALARLAAFEDYDLGRALGSVDGDAVATGADPAVGLLEGAFSIMESAALRAFGAYDVLQGAPDAAPADQDLFALRRDELGTFLDDVLPDVRAFLSRQTTAVLVPTDRFGATSGEARARSVQFVCIDRNVYPLADDETSGVAGDDAMAYGDPTKAGDCPDLVDPSTRVVVITP